MADEVIQFPSFIPGCDSFEGGYNVWCASPDSEEQFSSVSHDSACYVVDETICPATEELNHDVVAHSELWKWVDAPVFVPKKSVNATQESEKNFHPGSEYHFIPNILLFLYYSSYIFCRK